MKRILKLRDLEGHVYNLDLSSNEVETKDGRVIKMDLGQGDVHADAAVADAVMGYKLEGSIADELMPVVQVKKASDKYYIWDKDETFKSVENVRVGPGGNVGEISSKLSTSAYSTEPYALGSFIPVEVEANADSGLLPRRQAARRIMNALKLAREYRVQAKLRNAANYGAAFKTTLGASFKWNGGASSDPVKDLLTRIQATGAPISGIGLSERTWHDFIQNANVQKYFAVKSSTPGLVSSDASAQMSALLSLPPFTISKMKAYNPSTGVFDYVWGDDVVLYHQPPSGGMKLDGQDISTGYTFRWSEADTLGGDATSAGGGFFQRSFFDPRRGARSGTVMVLGHNDGEQFISDFVSGLIVGAHQ